MNENNIAISLKEVNVTYQERQGLKRIYSHTALDNVTFDIYKGEKLGVIGRNGAGKSTLLRLLTGIIKPDVGEVIHNIENVSLMSLSAGFDNNLSGRQNAVISGMLLGHRKKDILKKIDDIKKFSELGSFFEKPVKTYSSGMRARLGFSIAMYTSPDVLLIDEVLSVGDADFKDKAELALQEKFDSNMTVVIVSHSQMQISKLADRVIWIDHGEVRKQGLPREVFPIYNMSLPFDSLELKVVDVDLDDNYILIFENLEIINGIVYFDCAFIDKKSYNRDALVVDTLGGTKLNGPTNTVVYGNRFPQFKQAKKCRFHGGKLTVGEPNNIYTYTGNDMRRVLTITLDYYEKK
ncbi:ABC transporter ATP-binding protein [Vibrio cholerae]